MLITLEVPDQTYRALADLAGKQGQSLESLVRSTIEAITDDPLENWIGAVDSGAPGWPARHDEYLGQDAADPHAPSGPVNE